MTREEFAEHLHAHGISMALFNELLALYRQVARRAGLHVQILDIEYHTHDDMAGADISEAGATTSYTDPREAWLIFMGKAEMAGPRRIAAEKARLLAAADSRTHAHAGKEPTPDAALQIPRVPQNLP